MIELTDDEEYPEIIKGKWETKILYADGSISRTPTKRKQALDLSLKIAGAFAFYWIGRGIGEGLDNIPYISEWVPHFVNYHLPGADITDKIDRIVGLAGAVYGLIKSNSNVHHYDPNKIESLTFGPLTIFMSGKVRIAYDGPNGRKHFRG